MKFRDYGAFLQFLQNSGRYEQVNEALYKFLVEQGETEGQLHGMLRSYLTNQGYTGSLPEQMAAWSRDGYTTTGPALASAPTVSPGSTLIGTQETATEGSYDAVGGGSISVGSKVWRVSGTQVGTGATYTPTEDDDLGFLTYRETATESGGSADGTLTQTVSVGTVRYANAPTGEDASLQTFDNTQETNTYDSSQHFTVVGDGDLSGVTFTLASPVTGVSISPSGLLTFVSDTIELNVTNNILVTGTNSAGEDTILVPVQVTDEVARVNGLPTISGNLVEGQLLTVSPSTVSGAEPITDSYQWFYYDLSTEELTPTGISGETYELEAGDVGESLVVRQTATNFLGESYQDSLNTEPVAAAPDAATISALSVGSQESDGDMPISYTIDTESLVKAVVTTEATTTASAIVNETVTGAVDYFVDTWSPLAGTTTEALEGSWGGTFYLHVLPNNGGDADIATSASFSFDLQGPQFSSSSPVDAATDVAVDATLSVTFDENVSAGTGNFYIYEDDVLTETVAVGSTSITTNTVTIPHTDFTAEAVVSVEWDAGVVVDAVDNPVAASNTEVSFTVAAAVASNTTPVHITRQVAAAQSVNPYTRTVSVVSGTKYSVLACVQQAGSWSGTANGNAMTLLDSVDEYADAAVFEFVADTTGDIVIAVNIGNNISQFRGFGVQDVTDRTFVDLYTGFDSAGNPSVTPPVVDGDGWAVLGFVGNSSGTWVSTNIENDYNTFNSGSIGSYFGDTQNGLAATPTISLDAGVSANSNIFVALWR